MKSLLMILMFCPLIVSSQVTDTLEVGPAKPIYLIFGSEDVKFHHGNFEQLSVKKWESKLVLTTIEDEFEETNLFVEVENEIYLFIVKYDAGLTKFIYDFSDRLVSEDTLTTERASKDQNSSGVWLVQEEPEEDSVQYYKAFADSLINRPDRIKNRGVVKYKLGIYLKDVVFRDDKIFLEFEAVNKGNIPYVIDFYQFRVKSVKRRIKSESFQEILLVPILEHKRPKRIEGKQTVRYVIVMDKFVLIDSKKLVVEHWEYNGKDMSVEGGRKVNFDIFSKDILNVGL